MTPGYCFTGQLAALSSAAMRRAGFRWVDVEIRVGDEEYAVMGYYRPQERPWRCATALSGPPEPPELDSPTVLWLTAWTACPCGGECPHCEDGRVYRDEHEPVEDAGRWLADNWSAVVDAAEKEVRR